MTNVLALDPGYGNTKVCFNGQTASISPLKPTQTD